ncbi:MAG: biotin/lipoyl-binding protein [Planctomycetota bacterium]
MWKKLLVIPALALGVLGFWLLTRGERGPEILPPREIARRVRVIEAPKLAVVPRALGFGVVRPGREWKAVPEVSGRIVELDARVREGNIFRKDAVLVRIDTTDYDLEVAQAEAQIQSIDAQVAQLDARKKTIEASIQIEKDALALFERDFARVKKLVDNDSLPAANLDEEQRRVLTQRARLQELENNLALIAPDRNVLATQRVLEQARLQKAKLSVERCVIRAPFDCRLGPVNVEQSQVVQVGQELLTADSIATSEVPAQLPIGGLSQLFATEGVPIDATDRAIESRFRERLSARVFLETGGRRFEWDATVTRVKGIDPETRTVGMVVSVADSYKQVQPGRKPPLVRGMFVEVEIKGPPIPGQVVVPRAAMQSGRVYLLDAENRLDPRAVDTLFVQSSFAVIRGGLQGGETLVLSDLFPAVKGMLLDPEVDAAAAAHLADDAGGRTRMR